MAEADITLGTIRTAIPARLDRLPWSRFHWRILIGLGTVWILDGLEVTIVGALGTRLTEPDSGIALDASQVGLAASFYVLGAVLGALFFGYLTDRFGRRRLFLLTLGVYLVATVATAFAINAPMFYLLRFLTGSGIGGEYAAINSAIDELIPARVRGRVDLIVNGSYWLGASAGAALTLVLLNKELFAPNLGWRFAFALGAALGLVIMFVRRTVPESPRWLFIHGRKSTADELVQTIEQEVQDEVDEPLEEPEGEIEVKQRRSTGFGLIIRTVIRNYRSRSFLGLSLFIGQSFLYNAVFFTQALVLGTFFDVSSSIVGLYIIPLAIGNFLGPVLMGPLFDIIGRRSMITLSYVGSGVLLIVTGILFQQGTLTAVTLTIAWSIVFFFASAGASAAYLTVSEIFPMETRALAIAFFYAVGTGLGGIVGPGLFGQLVETGEVGNVAFGYYLGAVLMIAAGMVELAIGVQAEQQGLERIAKPISAMEAETAAGAPGAEGREKAPAGARAGRDQRPIRPRGPRYGYSPMVIFPTITSVQYDRHVDRLVEALGDRTLSRDELARAVKAGRWGPGMFGAALRNGLATGRVAAVGRRRYARGLVRAKSRYGSSVPPA